MSRTINRRICAGVDIGGTKTAVLAVRLPDLDVAFREVFATQPDHGAARLRSRLAAVLDRMRSELGLARGLPVGISVPEVVGLDGLIMTDAVVPGLTGDLRDW